MINKIGIFTGCNARYLPGATATVRSVRRFHPDVDVYCFVPPELVGQAEAALGEAARVICPPRPVDGVSAGSQVKFARLFMAERAEYDVVLWLDSDTVVCRPIDELFAVSPGRVRAVGCHPTNRVPHVLPAGCRAGYCATFPALTDVPGFNSGVLALRPADWPTLVADMERLLGRLGFDRTLPFGDQALLNGLFQGRSDLLPFEFNWTEMFDAPPADGLVRVVHFCSNPKPWEPGYPRHEPGYWFWLKYGLGETDPAVLRAVRRRIRMQSPRRLLGRLIRKVWLRK